MIDELRCDGRENGVSQAADQDAPRDVGLVENAIKTGNRGGFAAVSCFFEKSRGVRISSTEPV